MRIMKTVNALIIIAAIFLGTACEKDDDNGSLPNDFMVNPYSNVVVDGEVNVLFNTGGNSLKSSANEFRVVINASDEQRKSISVSSEDGVLTITAGSDIILSDDVSIELTSEEIDEIKLESDQKAVFEGVFDQDQLTVKTEASSELSLFGVRINNIYSKQEGESIFNLSGWEEQIEGEPTYAEERGELICNTSLRVDDSLIVVGDSVVLSDSVPIEWKVYGDEVTEYFLITYCDFKTEGNTTIHAEEAPISEININLEGTSEAKVFAIDKLTGKGEGSSMLYYLGTPDISGFTVEGGAQIIPIE